MTATGQNVTMISGDDKVLTVTVVDEDNLPWNLTGCSVNYVVYKGGTGVIIITKTTTSGISLTNPVNGIMEISLIPSDTEDYTGYYLHECEITDTQGRISTIFTGKFTINDSKA